MPIRLHDYIARPPRKDRRAIKKRSAGLIAVKPGVLKSPAVERESRSPAFEGDPRDLNLFVGPGLEPVLLNSFGGPVAYEIHMLKVLRHEE